MEAVPPEERETQRIHAIISAMRKAWYSGRRVVPVIGAGLSNDSGIPVTGSLIRYFCKFQEYLNRQAYFPAVPEVTQDDPFGLLGPELKKHPSKYVQSMGWPDRYELTQDLTFVQQYAQANGASTRVISVDDAIKTTEREIMMAMNPGAIEKRSWVKDTAVKNLKLLVEEILRQVSHDIDGKILVSEYRDMAEKLSLIIADSCKDAKKKNFTDDDLDKFVPYYLFGDWRNYIQHFTHYEADLADALFHKLCSRRKPSIGHRYVAFLIKLLGVRTVFTFNFDDLIEKALFEEGVEHQAFAMEHGSNLPHRALVYDVTAVVKMHGSTHSLLLDQRLDSPLKLDYKRRYLELVGKGSLFLVAGCSGGDGRLRDLIEWLLDTDKTCTVAWLHFEEKIPEVLINLQAELKDRHDSACRLLTAPTHNLGLSLQHLYSGLTGRHPASNTAYPAYVYHPYKLEKPILRTEEELKEYEECGDSVFVVLSSLTERPDHKSFPSRTASEALLDHAAKWVHKGYQVVWVDLESAHTLASVVGSIIDQCRALDTQLAPSVLPVGEKLIDARNDLAVRSVRDALRRSRYVVILDGLEAYLWPPTSHHGEATKSENLNNIESFVSFLVSLARATDFLGGSRFILSVDESRHRSSLANATQIQFDNYIRMIDNLIEAGWKKVAAESSTRLSFSDHYTPPCANFSPLVTLKEPLPWGDRVTAPLPDDLARLMLLTLTTVRRGRPLGTLRQLLRPLVKRGRDVDLLLDTMTKNGRAKILGVTRLEGGALWYHRPVRDYIYAANSEYAGTQQMSKLLGNEATKPEEYRLPAAQLMLLTTTHLRVARTLYTHVYVQSQDAVTFLEYTYHRISALRYLIKLIALLSISREEVAGDVINGIGDAGKLGRSVLDKKDWHLLWKWVKEGSVLMDVLRGVQGDKTVKECVKSILPDLQELHRLEITALSRGWARAEPKLRTQLPPEQLLFWCECLLNDDIPNRINRISLGRGTAGYPPTPGGCVNDRAVMELKNLTIVLKDFSVKLTYERSIYYEAIQQRYSQLLDDLRPGDSAPTGCIESDEDLINVVSNAPVAPESSGTRLRLVHLHYLLDIAACRIKLYQELYSKKTDYIILLRTIRLQLDRLIPNSADIGAMTESYLDPTERLVASGDYHEAKLRLEYFCAEAAIGDVCLFARDIGFLGRPPDQVVGIEAKRESVHHATKHIENGLASVRSEPTRADGRLRSLILDPTDGGGLYSAYRAAFFTQQARMTWLGPAREAVIEAREVRFERLEDAFESAFQSFDLARGGLGTGNHQIAALNELFRVEACLAFARFHLYPDTRGETLHPDQVNDRIDRARAKLESARLGLHAARNHLHTGRRNVIWWKLFCALAAQYNVDLLLTVLTRTFTSATTGSYHSESEPASDQTLADTPEKNHANAQLIPSCALRPVSLREVLPRIRRGLSAIRSGIDLGMVHSPQNWIQEWPWLKRVWVEMITTGYVLGRTLLVQNMTKKMADEFQHNYIVHALTWLNRTARLVDITTDPDPNGPEMFIKSVLDGTDQYQLIAHAKICWENARGQSPSSLELRWNLLTWANPNTHNLYRKSQHI